MKEKSIYLAAGCFWGAQEYFNRIKGVASTSVGYANGNMLNPTYEQVCKQDTGYAECVKVIYDDNIISLNEILDFYFRIIDPKSVNRQGNDIGSQYRTGIYTVNQEDFNICEEFLKVKTQEMGSLAVELEKLENFYDAEEYHQDYLKNNPNGYCCIDLSIADISHKRKFTKPKSEEIKEKLSELEYKVTQDAHTEPPFSNEINDKFERGIYVDIVTGEPLFSSKDKFNSNCGWPAFSLPIENGRIIYADDNTIGMNRTEVKSYIGKSHLGHVFNDGPIDSGGLRYCINGASLRFIPFDKMGELGYSDWISYV